MRCCASHVSGWMHERLKCPCEQIHVCGGGSGDHGVGLQGWLCRVSTGVGLHVGESWTWRETNSNPYTEGGFFPPPSLINIHHFPLLWIQYIQWLQYSLLKKLNEHSQKNKSIKVPLQNITLQRPVFPHEYLNEIFFGINYIYCCAFRGQRSSLLQTLLIIMYIISSCSSWSLLLFSFHRKSLKCRKSASRDQTPRFRRSY